MLPLVASCFINPGLCQFQYFMLHSEAWEAVIFFLDKVLVVFLLQLLIQMKKCHIALQNQLKRLCKALVFDSAVVINPFLHNCCACPAFCSAACECLCSNVISPRIPGGAVAS